MAEKSKVFGIGFHKTGTSSLANALYTLGYNVTGYFGVHDPEIEKNVCNEAFIIAHRFDAVQDTPWPVLYKDLDQWFPGSKFILTVRAADPWYRSVKKHFKRHRISAHEWIYGVSTAAGNERVYIHRYEKHNQEVQEYFKDRPNDLLVMDITQGDGWEKLCPFLGVEIPHFDFPAQNVAAKRSRNLADSLSRYLISKLDSRSNPLKGSQSEQGVTSAFLRDILHYHFSMLDMLWEGILEISEEKYNQPNIDPVSSLRNNMLRQAYEEYIWYSRLVGETGLLNFSAFSATYPTKESLYRFWREIRYLLRKHAADLTDESCNYKIPNHLEIVWEVYVHLMNSGTHFSASVQRQLEDFGIKVSFPMFIDFFYGDIQNVQVDHTNPLIPSIPKIYGSS